MNKLTFLFPPHPDEFFYSYCVRISLMNFFEPDMFFQEPFGNKGFLARRNRADGFIDQRLFFTLLERKSPMDYLLSTTLIQALFPFLTEVAFSYLIAATVNKYKDSFRLFPLVKNQVRKFKVCPICMEEDIKHYAHFYYHRSHQSTGVRVCHKHGCLLDTYEGEYINLFKSPSFIKEEAEITNFDKDYADFIYTILNPTEEALSYWKEKSKDNAFDEFLVKVKATLLENTSTKVIEPIHKVKEKILYFFTHGSFPKTENIDWLEHVVMHYPGDLLVVKCPRCGEEYGSTLYAESIGLGCHCERDTKSDEEVLKMLFDKQEDPRFIHLGTYFTSTRVVFHLFDRVFNLYYLVDANTFFFKVVDRFQNIDYMFPSVSQTVDKEFLEEQGLQFLFDKNHVDVRCVKCNETNRYSLNTKHIPRCRCNN